MNIPWEGVECHEQIDGEDGTCTRYDRGSSEVRSLVVISTETEHNAQFTRPRHRQVMGIVCIVVIYQPL